MPSLQCMNEYITETYCTMLKAGREMEGERGGEKRMEMEMDVTP